MFHLLPSRVPSVLALLVAAGLVVTGCDSDDDGDGEDRIVTASVAAPADTTTGVAGTVRLSEHADGLRVTYDLGGLAPGPHGLHVHENASCAPADHDDDGTVEAAGAAGGHYDPLGTMNHAGPSNSDPASRHLGDLGNITAGSDGEASGEKTVAGLRLSGTLSGASYSFLAGRAIIVHSGQDDLQSDPGGNSGDRVGCGLLQADS